MQTGQAEDGSDDVGLAVCERADLPFTPRRRRPPYWTTVCCIAHSAAAARVDTPILP